MLAAVVACCHVLPRCHRLPHSHALLPPLHHVAARYYIYNEVAFLALAEVAPVTHAVTNTVKRVVIILEQC